MVFCYQYTINKRRFRFYLGIGHWKFAYMKPEAGSRGAVRVQVLARLQELVWGPALLFLFLGTGVVCTVKVKGFQFTGFGTWWRATAGRIGAGGETAGEQIKTACTALAATVGTGNIAGVATALAAGGPGAVFWMWISAFLGMATAYAEVFLGIRYRNTGDSFGSGPFAYLEKGLGWKRAAFLYALFCVLASLGMGSMVQANSIADSVTGLSSVSAASAGTALVFLTGAVILGGAKRISRMAEFLVPFSAGGYLFFGGIVVFSCYERLPAVFGEIFSQALNLKSAAGGAAGYTMAQAVRFGVARGVFSNEAGLGSLAVLHGTSEYGSKPEEQGMWAMFEVFFDTVVCCTLTALILLCMGEKGEGSGAVAICFSRCFGRFGGWFTAASMALFAFASIIAWFYLGRQAAEYLLRGVSCREQMLFLYTLLYLGAVFLGCILRLTAVWMISDLFNGLMAVPNLLGVLCLIREVKKPEKRKKQKI